MPAERYFCSRRLRFLPVRDIGRSESLLARGRHSRTVPRRCRNLVWQCHHSERSSNPFSLFPIRLGGRTVASWKLQCCSGCLINRCTVIAQSQDLASVVKKKKKTSSSVMRCFLVCQQNCSVQDKRKQLQQQRSWEKTKAQGKLLQSICHIADAPERTGNAWRSAIPYIRPRNLGVDSWSQPHQQNSAQRERERERCLYIYLLQEIVCNHDISLVCCYLFRILS